MKLSEILKYSSLNIKTVQELRICSEQEMLETMRIDSK